jgi:CRP/FNR family transcriptional regulator, cyclic AMP receptor protein
VVEASFLERVGEDARAELLAMGRRRELPAGQVLFSEGDDGAEVIVVLAGHVKITTVATTGREVILEVMDPGALLGEFSAVDGQPRSATAIALTPITVSVVPTRDFSALLARDASVGRALLELLVARLRRSSERQLEFGTSDALGRLCGCLLSLLERYGDEGDSPRHARLPLAQHEIAAMTGLSREAVVKALRAMRSLNWLELHAREVTIIDEPAMRARARP